jgi:hypothetical protein
MAIVEIGSNLGAFTYSRWFSEKYGVSARLSEDQDGEVFLRPDLKFIDSHLKYSDSRGTTLRKIKLRLMKDLRKAMRWLFHTRALSGRVSPAKTCNFLVNSAF